MSVWKRKVCEFLRVRCTRAVMHLMREKKHVIDVDFSDVSTTYCVMLQSKHQSTSLFTSFKHCQKKRQSLTYFSHRGGGRGQMKELLNCADVQLLWIERTGNHMKTCSLLVSSFGYYSERSFSSSRQVMQFSKVLEKLTKIAQMPQKVKLVRKCRKT